MPTRDVIPIASDQFGATAVAKSRLPGRIVNIASIDIAKAGLVRDLPSASQPWIV